MIVSVAQAQLFLLAFTRLMAVLVQVPVLGGRVIPNRVRLVFGVALTALLLPWQPLPADAQPLPLLALGAALLRELITGWLAGFAATLTFGAVQMLGEFMGLSGGFASARLLNPAFEGASTVLDQLFLLLASLLFLLLNGHHLVLIGLQQTFIAVPLNSPLPDFTTLAADRVMTLAQQLLATGLLLALPVVGAALMADVALGLLARVAPQIQVFFLEAPLKVLLVLVSLTLSLGALLPLLGGLLQRLGPRLVWMLGG